MAKNSLKDENIQILAENLEVKDDIVVESFLKAYTYNDIQFENNNELTDQDIVFYEVAEGAKADTTSGISLFDSNKLSQFDFKYEYIQDDVNDTLTIEQTYYIIKIREGAGKEIRFADSVNLTYKEKLIVSETEYDNTNLDEEELANAQARPTYLVETSRDSIDTNTWSNTLSFQAGMRAALTNFKTASVSGSDDCQIFNVGVGGDLTTNNDFGIGIVVVPSGLAYYSTQQYYNNRRDDDDDSETEEDVDNEGETDEDEFFYENEEEDFYAYRNYVYTFSTYNATDGNLDGDFIPAYLEKSGDEEFDFYDSDNDGVPNYLDQDDDGDGVLTIFEVEIDDFDENTDEDCDGLLNNDNEVKYIYSDENSDDGVKYVFPDSDEAVTTDKENLPYHLDSEIEYED